MAACLRRWMYLDHNGIVSLHDQVFQNRVIEQTRTLSKSSDKSLKGAGGFSAFGSRLEVAKEATSAEHYEIMEKTAPSDERLLLELEAALATDGGIQRIAGAPGIAEVYAGGAATIVTGILRFRWAATYSNNPMLDAKKKQMVEFVLDREANADAGVLSVPVRMAGSLQKCADFRTLGDGSLSPGSHLAFFLRELARDALPLGFFAQLQPWPRLIYLKPLAIWFP